ncbi:MAG TPA: tRNA-dihydrouridine synthase family protein [Candidatus Nanoarchaeia archaeon]|nr:tRNA-dihydrouridine synthase family protein [Candidatus Nanoarchaeia archaeon]
MKTLKIGKIKISPPVFLAPMVEVTDLAYRDICRKNGAAVAYTEMLHVNAITHTNPKTESLMKTSKKDSPIGIQITGSKIEDFKAAIPYLKKYDLVDINCGCPSSRITDSESGSALLKNPDKIAEIVKLLKDNGLTVTVKVRLGYTNNNVIETAKKVEKAGADAITVHARMASQRSSVPADWSWIKKVKENVKIPVIGNGDIFSGKQAKEMLDICDGVMIARAAIGNPMIFKQIKDYLQKGKETEFDFNKNIKFFLEYLKLAKKYKIVDLGRIKYIGSSFIRNTPGAAEMRNQFMQLKTYDEVLKFISIISRKNIK